jgi:hypothetical protein
LGVDSACYKDGCSGKYFSLDGTTEMNGFAEEFNAWSGNGFDPIKGNEVLVLNNGMISTAPFDESHISALPCETKNEENLFLATCDMKINDFVEKFSAEKFVCPPGCSSGNVYGSNIYHGDSTICLAAMHSGQFDDVGAGYIVAHFKANKKAVTSFAGTGANDIESEALDKQSKGYTFFKVEETCPDEINKGVLDAKEKFFLQETSHLYSHDISIDAAPGNTNTNTNSIDIDDGQASQDA